MKRWCKFSYLILFIHLLACATAPNTRVASNHDEIAKEKPSVEGAAAVEVTVENSYEAPLNKSPKETSNSEIYLIPSRKEFPDIKIIDALARAKDEEQIIVEESNGDRKRTSLILHLIFIRPPKNSGHVASLRMLSMLLIRLTH